MLTLLIEALMIAQASEWDCRNWIREYDQLVAQIQYEDSGQSYRDCVAREGPGRASVCGAASSGRMFGNAIASLGGSSPRQRVAEQDAVIRQQCFPSQ